MALASVTHAVSHARRSVRAAAEELAQIGDERIRVLVHRPRSDAGEPGRLLLVFPGYERNADDYAKKTRRLARTLGATVMVPELDQNRFPRERYQRGGVSGREAVASDDACMGLFVGRLVEWARNREASPDAPFFLFGHSAGAQMLSRVAAFCPPTAAERIVIANPSSHVAPSPCEPGPFGFASIIDIATREARLRCYLAQPLTIYLGIEDTGCDRLDQSRAARRQGRNRLERGKQVFELGQQVAAHRGWPFKWRLVLVPGVGHSSRDMLHARQMLDALASTDLR